MYIYILFIMDNAQLVWHWSTFIKDIHYLFMLKSLTILVRHLPATGENLKPNSDIYRAYWESFIQSHGLKLLQD